MGEVHAPGFQDLVRHRVHDVLLVSSPYESFILAEDGQPHALMLSEFLDLNIHHIPGFHHVTSGREALERARRRPRPNLVIASMHLGDMHAGELARRMHETGGDIPVVLLAYDGREVEDFLRRTDADAIDRAFLWQGDARLFLAIVKYAEDRMNVAHDTGRRGVQVILVVEDNVKYYSSFLPVIYAEVIAQARKLAPEGLNLAHRLLRVQARPKILLCSTFEEAIRHFTDYQANVLGVISDVQFPRDGVLCADAGMQLARRVRALEPDVPIILHSRSPEHREEAQAEGASFLLKGSPLLLQELRGLMTEYFSFGDFVFRLPDGQEVGRAPDLRSLEERLASVPAESIAYHAQRNHFSRWLTARTEFELAQRLRPRRLEDYASVDHLREELIREIREYRVKRGRALVSDFSPETFDKSLAFARLGEGSLGGKARGLAFVNHLLDAAGLRERFPGVRIGVPPSLVLATGVLEDFLARNGLRDFVIGSEDEAEVARRILEARFPPSIERDLGSFLWLVREPLAVRSSSLLEDSPYQPFAGIYDTRMIANDHEDVGVRLERLLLAIKRVYASTFGRRARRYFEATGQRLEEERMAVVIQSLVGGAHQGRFYPDLAGVVRSHNYYPHPPMRAEDGIAAVALGFGETVVDGEACFRFCPRYPQHVVQFSSVADVLRNSQRRFYALTLGAAGEHFGLNAFDLDAAEGDGTLAAVGSTWSADNDAIYDGIGREGLRLVTFAPILRHGVFPLAEILAELLRAGETGIGGPVEIEFAVNLAVPAGAPREFGFLQLRPLVRSREMDALDVGDAAAERVLCRSTSVLGHGRIEGIRDLVVIDRERFERGRSRESAAEVARLNAELIHSGRPYALIGVGRWGSREPTLGVPVAWDDITGARVIVEAGFRDLRVTPSQGTHFFQNLTVSGVGYLTVNPEREEGELDWAWLAAQPALVESAAVRHLRLARPLTVLLDGRAGRGIILKPEGPA